MFNYQFRPSLFGFVIVACCVVVFCKLGAWQYHKAEQKIALQAKLEQGLAHEPIDLPNEVNANVENLRYKRFKFTGTYQTQFQIFLDNQVSNEKAGYHVITPVKIKDSNRYVLVDRGWVAALANHSQLPIVATPQTEFNFSGHVWVPSSKFFTLAKPEAVVEKSSWNAVWQNMDMQSYMKATQLNMLPFVIRLDANVDAAGFARDWPLPNERITTHIGYAYQWYGFAVAAALIYLVVSFKRKMQ